VVSPVATPPQTLSLPPHALPTALASLVDALLSLLAVSTAQSVAGGRLPFSLPSSQPTKALDRACEYLAPSLATARSHLAHVGSFGHPFGVSFGSAGSLPASISVASRKPSPSWSTPMRSPEPTGTAVKVSS
jgi:hypothetical protein